MLIDDSPHSNTEKSPRDDPGDAATTPATRQWAIRATTDPLRCLSPLHEWIKDPTATPNRKRRLLLFPSRDLAASYALTRGIGGKPHPVTIPAHATYRYGEVKFPNEDTNDTSE